MCKCIMFKRLTAASCRTVPCSQRRGREGRGHCRYQAHLPAALPRHPTDAAPPSSPLDRIVSHRRGGHCSFSSGTWKGLAEAEGGSDGTACVTVLSSSRPKPRCSRGGAVHCRPTVEEGKAKQQRRGKRPEPEEKREATRGQRVKRE